MDAKELIAVLDAAENVVSADRAAALDDSLINTLDSAVKAARAAIPSDAAQAPVPDDIIQAVQAYGDARADGGDSAGAIGNVIRLLRAAPVAPHAAGVAAQAPDGWKAIPSLPPVEVMEWYGDQFSAPVLLRDADRKVLMFVARWSFAEDGWVGAHFTEGPAPSDYEWLNERAKEWILLSDAAPVAPTPTVAADAAAPSAFPSLAEFDPEHPLLANAEQPEEVWSADRETFDCDSLGELLDSNELEVGQTVYVGEKVPVDATSYIEVEILLDSLSDRAFDHVGEAADGYPDVSQEARDELEALLSAWVQKNAKPNFYRVKRIREYTITQQDIGAAQ